MVSYAVCSLFGKILQKNATHSTGALLDVWLRWVKESSADKNSPETNWTALLSPSLCWTFVLQANFTTYYYKTRAFHSIQFVLNALAFSISKTTFLLWQTQLLCFQVFASVSLPLFSEIHLVQQCQHNRLKTTFLAGYLSSSSLASLIKFTIISYLLLFLGLTAYSHFYAFVIKFLLFPLDN